MWAWLLSTIIMPLLNYELPIIEKSVVAWAQGMIAAYKQKQVDAANVQTEQKAADSGDHDALADAETALLNGDKPADS